MDNCTTITVLQNADAERVLSDAAFLQQWKALYERCSWASVFQSVGFVTTWYTAYGRSYSALLVTAVDSEGQLNGLATLAFDTDRRLCFAGDHQAEYQAWLASGDGETQFFEKCIAAIESHCGPQALHIKYLLPKVPLPGCSQRSAIGGRIQCTPHQRPLWKLTTDDIAASLKKKSNRSKLNRLKREGEFTVANVADADSFAAVLDVVAPYYDARQGALNNSFPFFEDDRKRSFHIELLAKAPETIDINVARLDEKPVSVVITMRTDDIQHSAIVAHSPVLARHSVGKLHLFLAALDALDSNVSVFDLTPGGDPWKERFASHHDTVFELILHRTVGKKKAADRKQALLGAAKFGLGKFNITPDQLRRVFAKLTSITAGKLWGCFRRLSYRNDEHWVYSLNTRAASDQMVKEGQYSISKNSLTDLLQFEENESCRSKRDFLNSAIRRLEAGETVYTVSEKGRLLYFGWLIARQAKTHFTGVSADYVYPVAGAVLYDFYASPKTQEKGFCQAVIMQMLQDVSDANIVDNIYISCPATERPLQYMIEKIGFQKISTITRTVRLGYTTVIESGIEPISQ